MKAIGIDIGTTSICFVTIDINNGNIIKSKTINSNAFINSNKKYERIQSVNKIIKIIDDEITDFIDREVEVIGVTGQMHGILYVDKEGKAVSDLYTWQDKRGDEPYLDTTYAKFLNSYSGYGCVSDFYNKINNLIPKNAETFCTIHDYVVMHLCNNKRPLIHISNACSFGCFDLKNKKYNIDVNVEFVDGYYIAGYYKGIPVSVAIGDNQASVLSSICEEDVLINIGTGSQVSLISNREVDVPNIEIRPYFEGKYLLVGSSLCGGRAYSLLKDFYEKVYSYIPNMNEDIYEIMNKMIEKETNELKVNTTFSGTRNNPNIKGNILDISIDNFTPGALNRGVLKGIVNELYDMYLSIGEKKINIIGSGNAVRKNKHLVNYIEEIFDNKIKVPNHIEEAAYGACLYALLSNKNIKNMIEIKKIIKYKSGD